MSDKEEADNSNSCTETGESDYSLSDRSTFSHSCSSSSMVHLQKKAIQAKNKGTTMKVRLSMLHDYVLVIANGVLAETVL